MEWLSIVVSQAHKHILEGLLDCVDDKKCNQQEDGVMFPLDRIEDIRNHPSDFKLLERVPFTRDDVQELLPIKLGDPIEGEKIWAVVFLDTETTGISHYNDKIIELGMVRCTFSFTRRRILSIDRIYDGYEDPNRPIPPEITKLTGITDEMVKGQKFNEDVILNFVADNPLVIAHNAKFDRPFVERRFGSWQPMPWACSQKEIDWSAFDIGGQKLEFIVQSQGYFYDAHRACTDCLALCYLMYKMPQAFEMLIESSLRVTYRVDAYGAPFDIKDELKRSNYRWDGEKKVWYIQVNGIDSANAQVAYLENLYAKAPKDVKVFQFTANDRYRS